MWFFSAFAKSHGLLAVSSLLLVVGTFGPSLGAVAIVLSTAGSNGVRHWLRNCISTRFAWRYLVIALVFPVVVMALAASVHRWMGGTNDRSPAVGHVWLALLNVFLIALIGGPLGEEFGWRGYALPILSQKADWRLASLALGVIWGLWHVPLFFMNGTVQSIIPFWLFFASTISMSVLFAWLSNRTGGSVLPSIVLHTSLNAGTMVVPLLALKPDPHLRAYGIAVGLLTLTAIALLSFFPRAHPRPHAARNPT